MAANTSLALSYSYAQLDAPHRQIADQVTALMDKLASIQKVNPAAQSAALGWLSGKVPSAEEIAGYGDQAKDLYRQLSSEGWIPEGVASSVDTALGVQQAWQRVSKIKSLIAAGITAPFQIVGEAPEAVSNLITRLLQKDFTHAQAVQVGTAYASVLQAREKARANQSFGAGLANDPMSYLTASFFYLLNEFVRPFLDPIMNWIGTHVSSSVKDFYFSIAGATPKSQSFQQYVTAESTGNDLMTVASEFTKLGKVNNIDYPLIGQFLSRGGEAITRDGKTVTVAPPTPAPTPTPTPAVTTGVSPTGQPTAVATPTPTPVVTAAPMPTPTATIVTTANAAPTPTPAAAQVVPTKVAAVVPTPNPLAATAVAQITQTSDKGPERAGYAEAIAAGVGVSIAADAGLGAAQGLARQVMDGTGGKSGIVASNEAAATALRNKAEAIRDGGPRFFESVDKHEARAVALEGKAAKAETAAAKEAARLAARAAEATGPVGRTVASLAQAGDVDMSGKLYRMVRVGNVVGRNVVDSAAGRLFFRKLLPAGDAIGVGIGYVEGDNRQMITSGVGLTTTAVGAGVGGALGALGGPLAPATIPAGIAVGAEIGSLVGIGSSLLAGWIYDKNTTPEVTPPIVPPPGQKSGDTNILIAQNSGGAKTDAGLQAAGVSANARAQAAGTALANANTSLGGNTPAGAPSTGSSPLPNGMVVAGKPAAVIELN